MRCTITKIVHFGVHWYLKVNFFIESGPINVIFKISIYPSYCCYACVCVSFMLACSVAFHTYWCNWEQYDWQRLGCKKYSNHNFSIEDQFVCPLQPIPVWMRNQSQGDKSKTIFMPNTVTFNTLHFWLLGSVEWIVHPEPRWNQEQPADHQQLQKCCP